MKKLNIDQIIFEAPILGSLSAIARKFGVNVSTIRYELAKERKLQLIKQIIFWATDGKRYESPKRRMN